MAAEDIGGKILAIFFPIMAFVAMGFDHVVANMFFLPGRDLRRRARASAGTTRWSTGSSPSSATWSAR
jgi:formate/nitrite transporter FocA (FNT family)